MWAHQIRSIEHCSGATRVWLPRKWTDRMQHAICTLMYMVGRVSRHNSACAYDSRICNAESWGTKCQKKKAWHQSTCIQLAGCIICGSLAPKGLNESFLPSVPVMLEPSWTRDFHTLKQHEKTIKTHTHTPDPKSGNNRKHTPSPSPSPSNKDPSAFFLYLSTGQEWKEQAIQVELPRVYNSVSVAAWPGICQHLGQLPPCVTPAELREALWQQARLPYKWHVTVGKWR